MRWIEGEARPIAIDQLGDCFARYRLPDESAELAMARSLERCGQLAPVVVCEIEGSAELVDGFKRRAGARELGWQSLMSRCIEADLRQVRAAIVLLNRVAGRTRELEEAWVVQALVREDGMAQTEVAALLGRHKSWVSRRLALIERLCNRAREELRVGVLTPTMARPLTRLPQGNQPAVLDAARAAGLNRQELTRLVELLLSRSATEQGEILREPRTALASGARATAVDPRLSPGGREAAARIGPAIGVMHGLTRVLTESPPTTRDVALILGPDLARLEQEARELVRRVDDLLNEATHG